MRPGQILAQAVEATGSLDQNALADYMHSFQTVAGEMAFAKDGEWAKPRMVFTQFQNVAPNDVEQFAAGSKQPILWPPEFKTGDMIYPNSNAKKH